MHLLRVSSQRGFGHYIGLCIQKFAAHSGPSSMLLISVEEEEAEKKKEEEEEQREEDKELPNS
jgi:hypothetical protein